jgi:polygalacturonase
MSLTKTSFSMITGALPNVMDYGATGDGTTNDTAAIDAASTVDEIKAAMPKPALENK